MTVKTSKAELPLSALESMAQAYQALIETCGDDPRRSGLVDTPMRASRALAELTQGYHQRVDEIINGALFPSQHHGMVHIGQIEFYSLCEHHLLPFMGFCDIAYLPKGCVLGLSKFARIVDCFSRRFQIQENLTQQIADAIQSVTDCHGVAVHMRAEHMCLKMRGSQHQHPWMSTEAMTGIFLVDNDLCHQFRAKMG